jgi:hypothetical protein
VNTARIGAKARFTGEFALDPTQPNLLPFPHTTIGRVPKAYTAGKGYTIAPVELGKWLRVVDFQRTTASTTHMPDARRRLSPSIPIVTLLGLMLGATAPARANEPAAGPAVASHHVQALVDAMRNDLAVPQVVSVELVTSNPLKASVEPVRGAAGTYRLSIEQGFLEQLTPDELRAVIAHELGHVWIYNHFPYLQTEQGANAIALRVVSRESLDQVYGKVWANGDPGSLPRFAERRAAADPIAAGSPK